MPLLRPFSSPQLSAAGFAHGFFGRVGGRSQGPYASLNCSFSVGDQASHVSENLGRIASAFGVTPDQLACVSQVHGCNVLNVDKQAPQMDLARQQADALVGSVTRRILCIRTADCLPILIGCQATGAVAAIHAGWRGVVAGVVPQAVKQLFELGANPSNLVVAIGPHIGVDAFEVSPEVAEVLDRVAPHARAVLREDGIRPRVRLASLVEAQLHSLGIKLSQVDSVGPCTYSNAKDLFSYRRDGSRSGRQLSAIQPR